MFKLQILPILVQKLIITCCWYWLYQQSAEIEIVSLECDLYRYIWKHQVLI